MTAARKITVTIPGDLLDEARRVTGKGVTGTIIEGLDELRKRQQRAALVRLRGRVRFDLDLEKTR